MWRPTLTISGDGNIIHNLTKWFVRLAREMFAKAVELDPKFAAGYAGMANCDARLIAIFGEKISREETLALAARALALAPHLTDALVAHAGALSLFDRDREARQAYERALLLDPNSFEVNFSYANFCFRLNDQERSAELFKRALELQPDDCQSPLLLSLTLKALGRIEESREYGRLGVKRVEEQLLVHPESSRGLQLGACILAAMGETDRAKRWMGRALAIDPDDPHAQYNAACMWAQVGEPDKAFEALEIWSRIASRDLLEWIKHDPDMDPLRNDPRYQRLVERIDLEGRQVVEPPMEIPT